MKNQWQDLKSAAKELDTVVMVRLILQILNAAAGSEARFLRFREVAGKHEARLLAAAVNLDTTPISEIIGILCRAMFAIHHEGQPMAELEELILILKKAGNELDTMLMASTFERLYHLCESQTYPKGLVGLENIKMARDRVTISVAGARWDEVADSLGDMMWSLAEARPDFEALANWIRAGEVATTTVEPLLRTSAMVKHWHEILRNITRRYGNNSDELRLAQAEAKFIAGRSQVPVGDYAIFIADALHMAKQFHACITRLPLTIEADPLGLRNRIRFGRHTHISFNRTLRIPEDGKTYPLPADFGRLPILRVEDYAERVPAKWLEEGGFIIPLYQREALFLEFEGVEWRPTIAKVAVGRVNAVSGKDYDLTVRPHRQDYIVIPEQHWLDGINSGDGSVSQFVAMPLGEGYTIEAQITNEEKHGGFQLAVFDPKPQRFPDVDPDLRAAAQSALISRALIVGQNELLRMLPANTVRLIDALRENNYADVAREFGLAGKKVLEIVETVKQQFEEKLGKHGFDGVVPSWNLEREDLDGVSFAGTPGGRSLLKSQALYSQPVMPMAAPALCAAAVTEMGIAAGGRIKQQIVEDTYGAESWDQTALREVIIHIVNSAVFKELTGEEPPATPITPEQYQKYGIPWYSDYDERIPKVTPASPFRRILSIGGIDRNRGNQLRKALPTVEVKPEQILRIRTPDSRERVASFVERARMSFEGGRYRIAAREATLALDLDRDNCSAYLIRAEANYHLGFHADAESDASACIEREPGEYQAFKIRALSCLALGEMFLAKNDAESVLQSDPDDEIGIYVRAKASLGLSNYNEALKDVNRLLEKKKTDPELLRIKAEAEIGLSTGNVLL